MRLLGGADLASARPRGHAPSRPRGTRFRTVFLPACAKHSVVSSSSFIVDVLGSAIGRFRTAMNAFCGAAVRALSLHKR